MELQVWILCFQRDAGKLGCGQKKGSGKSKHTSSMLLEAKKTLSRMWLNYQDDVNSHLDCEA